MKTNSDPSVALASLRALAVSRPGEAAAQVVALVGSLNRPEYIQSAAQLIRTLASEDHGLPTQRIAVIGDVTLDGIAAAAAVALAGEGIVATSYIGPYGAL